MSATDSLLARYSAEIEERQKFIDGVVEAAEKDERDLTSQELEMIGRTRDRIDEVNKQVDPLRQAAEIARASRKRTEEIAQQFAEARDPSLAKPLEYRSAGEYVIDRWRAGLGLEEAVSRLDLYHRAAAHQTTTDNPGLLPEQIMGPVVNFVDAGRPLVNALGPRQLPSGSWSRPVVTQHTTVAEQSAEKAELASQKMTIGKIPVTATTWGGYVNLSRQNIDWTNPAIMDIVIQDLAGQYAIQTENEAVDTFVAGATAATVNLPTGANDADAIAAAFWGAAGQVYAGVKGAGRLLAAAPPQMLGLLGPVFAPINPSDAQSSGFYASNFGTGAAGAIAGIPVYVTAGMADNTMLVLSTSAAEVYEDRLGSLQVTEPSVLGVQVAYAGYFAPLIIEDAGIVKITKTP
jgi:HK97 family phage major capsid protein